MKLKVISLIVLLFVGNAAASSVTLVCDVIGTSCTGMGEKNEESIVCFSHGLDDFNKSFC